MQSTLEQRMLRVEQWNRVLLAVTAALLLTTGVLVTLLHRREPTSTFMGAPTPTPDTVTAKSFVLVDEAGKRRAVLHSFADGQVQFDLMSSAGKPVVGLGVSADDKAALAFFGKREQPLLTLQTSPNGNAGLRLYDNQDALRLGLTSSDSKSRLWMRSENNRAQMDLSVTSGESRLIAGLRDGSWFQVASRQDYSFLAMEDEEKAQRVTLGTDAKGETKLNIIGKDRKSGAWLGLEQDGKPKLMLGTPEGRETWTVEPK